MFESLINKFRLVCYELSKPSADIRLLTAFEQYDRMPFHTHELIISGKWLAVPYDGIKLKRDLTIENYLMDRDVLLAPPTEDGSNLLSSLKWLFGKTHYEQARSVERNYEDITVIFYTKNGEKYSAFVRESSAQIDVLITAKKAALTKYEAEHPSHKIVPHGTGLNA